MNEDNNSETSQDTQPQETPPQPEIPQFPNDRIEINTIPIFPSDRIEKGGIGDIINKIKGDIDN
ncbi:hypothetical protein [Empedobacter sp.]|uniref:hypothetical protein n=1 Tax=Empedobacter sp. TaxID=1927715 RepID=UPI0028B14845|nr:hypothetical protein [Empedobacter sp.]